MKFVIALFALMLFAATPAFSHPDCPETMVKAKPPVVRVHKPVLHKVSPLVIRDTVYVVKEINREAAIPNLQHNHNGSWLTPLIIGGAMVSVVAIMKKRDSDSYIILGSCNTCNEPKKECDDDKDREHKKKW